MPAENFLRRENPIHRDRLAVLGWAGDPQWPSSRRTSDHLDLMAGNDFVTA